MKHRPVKRRTKKARELSESINKAKSREAIYTILGKFRPPAYSTLLLMPGSSIEEPVLVSKRGYLLVNTYFVEKSAAVKANLTRRARAIALPPQDNQLRMRLRKAADVLLARKVRVDVAHLDFCTHSESGEMIEDTRHFFRSGVLADTAMVAVTWLAGREHDVEGLEGEGFVVHNIPMLGHLMNADRGRVARIWRAAGSDVKILQTGRYMNEVKNQPLLWTVFHVKKDQSEPHNALRSAR